ncbi:glycosyltransferase family 4 protein [bacterium]|nr:glycosyltransferase family 4 protein [candidate division CSSED10-310 bacterium]
MKIGLDVSCLLKEQTGVARYTWNLVEAMTRLNDTHEFILWGNALRGDSPSELTGLSNGARFRRSRLPGKVLLEVWARWHIPRVEWFTGRLDLFHSPNFFYHRIRRAATVATIHDLFFLKYPEHCERYGGRYFSRVVPRRAAEIDHVIAVSRATREDVVALLGIPPERVSVIHEAVDPRFLIPMSVDRVDSVLAGHGIQRPFLLAVGTIEPRKDYPTLLHAMALARQQGRALPDLVIAGRPAWGSGKMYDAIDRHKLRRHVRVLGYLSPDELPALYRGASLLVQPSLHEGFGLPVLEAMSLGLPVVASRIAALEEIAGTAAAFFEPGDAESLMSVLHQVLMDEAVGPAMVTAGRARAASFSWDRAAMETMQIYEALS